ncbi:polysaccharide deacetylase family protein [Spirulina subsalsa]|uniref:polysaccharide deacetylase family protein n=1 Tax=Spirulina subsalsa TaxID=54311 RepID=UPI000373BAF6|nr:polysaccharide deacetylase family protein [Spirulina subsalsa]
MKSYGTRRSRWSDPYRIKRKRTSVLSAKNLLGLGLGLGILALGVTVFSHLNSTTFRPFKSGNILPIREGLTSVFGQWNDADNWFIFSIPSGFQGQVIFGNNWTKSDKVIALTFDDGPWGSQTEEILNILEQNNIKATFFWIGQALQMYPETAKKVVAAGHAIGNHTINHRYHRMTSTEAAQEVDGTAKMIYDITGMKTMLFRPPGGVLNNGVADYAKKQGYGIVMWSQIAPDSNPQPPAEVIAETVLNDATPGGIVLLHDGGGDHRTTVAALPKIIEGLRQQGYEFVTVPQLLELQGQE